MTSEKLKELNERTLKDKIKDALSTKDAKIIGSVIENIPLGVIPGIKGVKDLFKLTPDLKKFLKDTREGVQKNIKSKIKDKEDKPEMKDGGTVRKGDSETVKMYHAGGEVKKKKSKVAGRLAMRGYGAARK